MTFVISKTYTTENAYRSHVLSKKHRENEVRALSRADHPRSVGPTAAKAPSLEDQTPPLPSVTAKEAPQTDSALGEPDADGSEDESALTLEEKIAAARSRLSSAHCLFCAQVSSSLDDNLAHMSGEHSFFIPDAEYLVDPSGLIVYLGEKVAVANICIYCSGRGREFHTLDAVRKHMIDKSHCKIAYDTENDMLEISDYYDFSSSYPDAEEWQRQKEEKRRAKKEKKAATAASSGAAEEWEDVDDDSGGEVDEVVDEPPSSSTEEQQQDEDDDDNDDDSSSDTDSLPENQLTIGDSHLELVLPSGSRIGHRSMRRYYAQSFSSSRAARGGKPEDPNSGRAIVRRLLADRGKSALVPRKGGFGAFGVGTEVVKARNRGEAREAGRHIREFRDQKRKEDYKTRVSFVHNHQKHYRDPLLQVSLSRLNERNIVFSGSLQFLSQ